MSDITPGQLRSLGVYAPPEPTPLEAEHAARLAERDARTAAEHGISEAEAAYCRKEGLDPEAFSVMRSVRTIPEYEAAHAELKRRREAREEAKRQVAVEQARKGLT